MRGWVRPVLLTAGIVAGLLAGRAGAARAVTAPMRAIAIAEDQRRWSDGGLGRWLADPDEKVRARAARAVGRLQDTTSVGALQPLLGDRAVRVRREAAFALGQIGSPAARAALESALGDPDTEVVDLSVEALGKLGDRAATARIVACLDSARASTRRHAAVALWRLADSSAADVLIRHLSEPDPTVRWRIAYALEKLPRFAPVIAPSIVPLLNDPDSLVRAHAARSLGRLKAQGISQALVGTLTDEDPAVLVNALRALASCADTSGDSPIRPIANQLEHADPAVRVTAATVLAERFAWPDSSRYGVFWDFGLRQLRKHLADPDAATRGACARALVARFGELGLEDARSVLEDSSVVARVALLDGLRVRGDAALAAPLLASSLRRGRPRLERMTAAEIAGQLGGRARGGPLESLLPALRGGTADRDLLFAAACAGALGDFGDSASVTMLAKLYAAHARDADADARISIRDALRQLAGRAVADSVERAHPAPAAPAGYPAGFEVPPRERGALLHTAAGDIEWAFDAAEAPQTVRNFVRLARRGYFDGLSVHRVVPDFVIQDGDPTGTGSGGPGYTIRCEYNRLRYEAGQVGMALSGKDTGGSQWFITLSPQPHLDGRYTIFAHVVRGLEVAKRITPGTLVRRVEILP